MKNQDFSIGAKTLVFLVIIGQSFGVLGAIAKIQHWGLHEPMLLAAIIIFFLVWLMVFIEVFRNNIKERKQWLLWLFLTPPIAPLIYLTQRNRVLNAK